MIKLLDLLQRLINELDIGGLPRMAFTNLMHEAVERYHMFFGIKTRLLVQQIVYAMTDLPGELIATANMRTDIMVRLERDHLKIGGQMTTLQYLLPLDDDHLIENPPMRRVPAAEKVDKSTQTKGVFQNKPVQAIILE